MLAVRGLDENADEEMLRYEFSKHAPIKVIFSSVIFAVHVFPGSLLSFLTTLKCAGSSSCQRQVHSRLKGICFCALLFGACNFGC